MLSDMPIRSTAHMLLPLGYLCAIGLAAEVVVPSVQTADHNMAFLTSEAFVLSKASPTLLLEFGALSHYTRCPRPPCTRQLLTAAHTIAPPACVRPQVDILRRAHRNSYKVL